MAATITPESARSIVLVLDRQVHRLRDLSRADGDVDLVVAVGDLGNRDVELIQADRIRRELKLYYPGFGWHAFRRQNITWRQQVGGATPLEAQRAAGHGSRDMTSLYTV